MNEMLVALVVKKYHEVCCKVGIKEIQHFKHHKSKSYSEWLYFGTEGCRVGISVPCVWQHMQWLSRHIQLCLSQDHTVLGSSAFLEIVLQYITKQVLPY